MSDSILIENIGYESSIGCLRGIEAAVVSRKESYSWLLLPYRPPHTLHLPVEPIFYISEGAPRSV